MVCLKKKSDLLDYSLCDQEVTLYRRESDGTITKTIYEHAFLDEKKVRSVEKTGSKDAMSFLLVIPGDADVKSGDKVIRGQGENIATDAEWRTFIPAKVPGLCVVSYVDKKVFSGVVAHVEAGG